MIKDVNARGGIGVGKTAALSAHFNMKKAPFGRVSLPGNGKALSAG